MTWLLHDLRFGLRALRRSPGFAILTIALFAGGRTAAAGLLLCLAGAIAAGRVLEAQLFQVGASDPAVLAGVAAFLGIVALAASWLPARRAAAVEPMVALRDE